MFASSCVLRSWPASNSMCLYPSRVTVMADLVLRSDGVFRAAEQLGHVQSHSGTPPIDAVPRTVISIRFLVLTVWLNALGR